MPERRFHLTVPDLRERERIDRYLARTLADLSRSLIQKLIEEGRVLVNGARTKASHLVSPGESIEVVVPEPRSAEIEPEPIPLDIVFEDPHLVVINKPAGMVVHPALGNYSGTLVNALLHHCRALSGVGGVQRPGIVHRLDKDTSGLLVVAKDDRTHQGLAEQFKHKRVRREYVAVVWGTPSPRRGRVESFLGRHPKDRKKIAVLPEGRWAVTNYEVVEVLGPVSLVRLELETGRTHQIRVHMSHIGHPVFGDPLYGGRGRKLSSMPKEQRQKMEELLATFRRQALHARTLGFVHPITGQWLLFESALPEDMALLLQQLRNELV
ncbi:MAG: RluA family pseudouridine synthase [candidate division KSB1 bacterium]|nr:RluA family pseudouridine synthase [candidate division KSB1 bacterium]